MRNRTPIPRDERPALPAFTPVPRKCLRHDGWTPERQRAFIEALADTGSVETACRMVNMSTEGAYALRRHAQAGELAAAWDAALNMGWRRLKDEAFERALNGQLLPVFAGGKLIGYRRQKNDRLLMFILRHYGPDGPAPAARPLTVNVINASATASAGGEGPPSSSASRGMVEGAGPAQRGGRPRPADSRKPDRRGHATTDDAGLPRRPADAPPERAALPAPDPRDTLATFAGVELDDEAQAQIVAALTANAARQRTLPPEEDPSIPYVTMADAPLYAANEMNGGVISYEPRGHRAEEISWELLGDDQALAEIEAAIASIEESRARGEFGRPPAQATPPASAEAPAALASPDPQPTKRDADADRAATGSNSPIATR